MNFVYQNILSTIQVHCIKSYIQQHNGMICHPHGIRCLPVCPEWGQEQLFPADTTLTTNTHSCDIVKISSALENTRFLGSHLAWKKERFSAACFAWRLLVCPWMHSFSCVATQWFMWKYSAILACLQLVHTKFLSTATAGEWMVIKVFLISHIKWFLLVQIFFGINVKLCWHQLNFSLIH